VFAFGFKLEANLYRCICGRRQYCELQHIENYAGTRLSETKEGLGWAEAVYDWNTVRSTAESGADPEICVRGRPPPLPFSSFFLPSFPFHPLPSP